MGSLSALSTDKELEVIDLQGYSNIDTYDLNIPFALTVAGVTWQLNDRQSLLKYCCLDTLAMVKVWEKLREMAGV